MLPLLLNNCEILEDNTTFRCLSFYSERKEDGSNDFLAYFWELYKWKYIKQVET